MGPTTQRQLGLESVGNYMGNSVCPIRGPITIPTLQTEGEKMDENDYEVYLEGGVLFHSLAFVLAFPTCTVRIMFLFYLWGPIFICQDGLTPSSGGSSRRLHRIKSLVKVLLKCPCALWVIDGERGGHS